MHRRRNSFRYAPDNHLNDAAIVGNMLEIGDECRIHVGENAIIHLRCQSRQRLQCAEKESHTSAGVRKLSGVDVLSAASRSQKTSATGRTETSSSHLRGSAASRLRLSRPDPHLPLTSPGFGRRVTGLSMSMVTSADGFCRRNDQSA